MDINKIKKPIYTDDRSDSHPTRLRLLYLAKLNLNSANELKVRENNNKLNKRLNHSNETIKKIRTYQKVIYDKDNNSRIKTYYREAPGEDSTNGVDPVGEFITEGAALSPLFKLAGTGLLYGAGRLGSNWARSKITSETMNKNLMGVNLYLNGTYGEATDYLFDKLHPELSKIGSKDLYKLYLYRMMPTSSTDKIYYHGSNSNFSDGLNSATKGAGSGAPETGNEMYFAKLPATVLLYVDGINTGIKDTNGFGHWNKLWWQAKEMLGNGQKDGWKAKTITQLRLLIPNKRGVYDETTHHGKLLSLIKSYYGALDMSDRDFAKNIFNIDLGKESFDDWVSKNKEQFELIWKNRLFNNGVYPVRINTTRPYIESGKDTYYRDRGVFDSKHDAVLSNNAKNEFGSDVAIVFDPKNNVNFLGSKADLNSFINFVNGRSDSHLDRPHLILGATNLYNTKSHLKNGGKLIPKGQLGIKTLPTVTVFGKNHALDLAHSLFPITKSLDIHTYYDPNFLPARDMKNSNFGDIEYMLAKYDTLPYYNNYRKPKQFQHKSTIIYNDNLKGNALEAIALDALSHGLRELDKDWKEYFLPNLTKAWSKNDYVLGDLDKEGDDPLGNAVDGNIRNLVVQDKYRPYMRYSPRQEVYNATVHTPLEKKAWGEAYEYITGNKLFPNGESLVVTPKGSYISK